MFHMSFTSAYLFCLLDLILNLLCKRNCTGDVPYIGSVEQYEIGLSDRLVRLSFCHVRLAYQTSLFFYLSLRSG